ncbi:S-adenosyl-L-methionine-dependent methyltransferase, partial [Violaceomyces palustris]
KGFDAFSYLSHRPTYPTWIYDRVLDFHFSATPRSAVNRSLAIDLGCGPGISTLPLLPHFDNVLGLDPSPGMISTALRPQPSWDHVPPQLRPSSSPLQRPLANLDYRVSNAEELHRILPPRSVDLVISAQAVHWFDHPRLWSSLSRVVSPGGTVAFWGYADFFLPQFPHLKPLITRFAQGDDTAPPLQTEEDPTQFVSLGSYWEQPGRSILVQGLSSVPLPSQVGRGSDASVWDESNAYRRMHSLLDLLPEDRLPSWPRPASTVDQDTELMQRFMTWDQLDSYLRTWSSYQAYLLSRPNPSPSSVDPIKSFLQRLKDEMVHSSLRAAAATQGGHRPDPDRVCQQVESQPILIRWPLSLIMIKKNLVAR